MCTYSLQVCITRTCTYLPWVVSEGGVVQSRKSRTSISPHSRSSFLPSSYALRPREGHTPPLETGRHHYRPGTHSFLANISLTGPPSISYKLSSNALRQRNTCTCTRPSPLLRSCSPAALRFARTRTTPTCGLPPPRRSQLIRVKYHSKVSARAGGRPGKDSVAEERGGMGMLAMVGLLPQAPISSASLFDQIGNA